MSSAFPPDEDAGIRPGEFEVVEAEPDQFRHPEPRGEPEIQHRLVSAAPSRRRIRGLEDRSHLLRRQVMNQPLLDALVGDGANPTHLLEGGGDLVLDVLHEGADRGQAEIPGPGRVRAVPLPMC